MDEFSGIFIVIIIGIGLFFLLRQLVLWYWRINEALELLKSTNEVSKAQVRLLSTLVEQNERLLEKIEK